MPVWLAQLISTNLLIWSFQQFDEQYSIHQHIVLNSLNNKILLKIDIQPHKQNQKKLVKCD